MKNLLLIVVAIFAFVVFNSVYTIHETQQGMLFRLGEIRQSNIGPGLHFKTPFINSVRKFDSRILTLSVNPQEMLTAEQKNLMVDFYAKWRIADTAEFYRKLGSIEVAEQRIEEIVKADLRDQISKRKISEAVSGKKAPDKSSINDDQVALESGEIPIAAEAVIVDEVDLRNKIMQDLIKESRKDLEDFGVKLVDVRVIRIDLPTNVNEDVYKRMGTERKQVANELRSEGEAAAKKIEANAKRRYEIIIAEAYRDAQSIRGEGDAKSADLYATAYNKNQEFYSFYRSLEAYRKTFGNNNDVMVIDPNSDFFKYFNSLESKP